MTPPIDIRADHLRIVQDVLRRHLPDGAKVWVFGSRATWMTKDSSDLDLALEGENAIPPRSLSALEAAFEESDLPFDVDIVDVERISERFRRIVEQQRVKLSASGSPRPNGRSSGGRFSWPNKWRGATIEDIAASAPNAVVGGPFGSNLVSGDYVPDGVPVIRGQNMGARWVTGDFVFVTPEKAESLKANLARPDDIVLTQRGTLGQVSIVPSTVPRFLVSQSQMKVTVDLAIADPLFLYYVLSSAEQRAYVRQNTIQTGVPHTNLGILRSTPIPVPPLSEQRAIAHILGTLDDKIELNRRMNATLEAMARALFRSWFVDFDPVRAKMEGRDTGLPKDIADLFPDRMADSELGEIPEGWTVGTLGDIAASPRRGIDPARVASDTPYIGLEHMPRRSVALADWGRAGSVSSNKSAFENRDILFGKLRPYFHKVGIAPVNGVCSTDIVVLDARTPRWSAFVLACVSSSGFVGYTSQTSTGTKMPRTSWHTMSRYELCQPTDSVATAFQRVVSSMLERIVANVHESRTLGVLRDALLPKLVSGELRVNAIEPTCGREGRPASVEVHGS